MASMADRVLQAYLQKFGKMPAQPNQLVSFSRTTDNIPTIVYSQAQIVLERTKTAIHKPITKKKIKARPKPIAKPKQLKLNPKFRIGDEITISKDRTGVIHYIGPVPEMTNNNTDTLYGIELTCGTLGHNDGKVKGKRYFQVEGKRAMFIPSYKIRRVLSKKDRERRNSYSELSAHVQHLQHEYAGDDAGYIYPSRRSSTRSIASDTKQKISQLVFETDPKFEKDEAKSPQYNSNHRARRGSKESPITSPNVAKNSSKKKRFSLTNNTNMNGGKKHQQTTQKSKRKQQNARRKKQQTTTDEDDTSDEHDDSSDDSDDEVSDLEDNNNRKVSVSKVTVKTFDTLLKYILRQKGQYKDGLLDVYANPRTHPLIVEAFGQMKELTPTEQANLWPSLLKRWLKYAHK